MEYLLFKIMIWFHIIAAVSVITMVFWAPLMLQMKVWNRTGVWKKHLLSFNKRSLQCLFVLWKCVWHTNKEGRRKVLLLALFDHPESRGEMLRSLCASGLVFIYWALALTLWTVLLAEQKNCKKTAIILKRARILIKNLPTYLACKIEMPECVCLQL